MAEYIKIEDEFQNTHFISDENIIGRGGQGEVYRTKDSDIAIKLALDDGSQNEEISRKFYCRWKNCKFNELWCFC